ncbi:MAG TPA: TRAP transporter large permease [Methylomirabilota bacterium]|nr:TRAP transporter large permease [Methylomirabilota bacterium]
MDWLAAVWFFGLLILFLAVGTPIAVALGATGLILIWKFSLGLAAIGPTFYSNLAKFQLLAIPFFIMAGLILERVGISERLVRLASLLIGPVHGGLALVAIVCCVFFAGISGSGPADTAALGTILIPAMAARGYARPFASALIASGGSIAIIIPPSIAFIIYGVITNTSIPALFAAGIVPGLIVGACLALPAYVIARRHGWRGERYGTRAEILVALRESVWGLLAPLIILGGIYGGVFTPTEAAVVAVFYGLFVGLVVYRSLDLATVWGILRDTVVSSAVVMLIVGFAGLYAWAGSTMGVIDRITQALLGLSRNPWVVIWVINLLVFLAGYILDGISIYYIFVPIIMPIMAAFGWDPVWIGVILTVNVAIGQVTPPVAVNLYVAANIARLSFDEISRAVWPFVLAMLVALVVITEWPALSTFLPALFGLK